MKLKAIMRSMVVLAAGLSGMAFAIGEYTPPERINCTLNAAGKLSCADFNRRYLVESTYTADLETGKEMVFNFASGIAFNANDEWSVFYTYKNADNKNVRLKTVTTSIKPDLKYDTWKAVKNYFTCTIGYMSCPITNLPSKS